MKTINATQLKSMLDQRENITLIDTLPTESYSKHHVPGAHSVPFKKGDFVRQVGDITPSKEHPVVVYCANTDCDLSPEAAQELEDHGFTDVRDFEEGIEGWEEAGYQTLSGSSAPVS